MAKEVLNRFQKINDILRQLELDLIQFVNADLKWREQQLPLCNRNQIIAIIWNLFTSKKYISKISYNDFEYIIDILINRLLEYEIQTKKEA